MAPTYGLIQLVQYTGFLNCVLVNLQYSSWQCHLSRAIVDLTNTTYGSRNGVSYGVGSKNVWDDCNGARKGSLVDRINGMFERHWVNGRRCGTGGNYGGERHTSRHLSFLPKKDYRPKVGTMRHNRPSEKIQFTRLQPLRSCFSFSSTFFSLTARKWLASCCARTGHIHRILLIVPPCRIVRTSSPAMAMNHSRSFISQNSTFQASLKLLKFDLLLTNFWPGRIPFYSTDHIQPTNQKIDLF